VAREMIRWMDAVERPRTGRILCVAGCGLFAGRMTATTLLGRWTQLPAVLTPEEMAVASAYYDIGEIGDIITIRRRRFWMCGDAGGVAKANKITLDEPGSGLESARRSCMRHGRSGLLRMSIDGVMWDGMGCALSVSGGGACVGLGGGAGVLR